VNVCKIIVGACAARLEVSNCSIASTSLSGILSLGNAPTLSAQMLRAAADTGATGLVCSVASATVILPPINPDYFTYVPEDLRLVPMALVVAPHQLAIYAGAIEASARAGVIRRAFLSHEDAQRWVRDEAQVWAQARQFLQSRQAPRVSVGTPGETPASRPRRAGLAAGLPATPPG
jgi:hypothetical protein